MESRGGRERRSEWRVSRDYDQIKNVVFVVSRKVHVLCEV